jgi:hypothetical protein
MLLCRRPFLSRQTNRFVGFTDEAIRLGKFGKDDKSPYSFCSNPGHVLKHVANCPAGAARCCRTALCPTERFFALCQSVPRFAALSHAVYGVVIVSQIIQRAF